MRDPLTALKYLFNQKPGPYYTPLQTSKGVRYWWILYSDDPNHLILHISHRGRKIGQVTMSLIEPSILDINDLTIDLDHQRNGLGTTVLDIISDIGDKRCVKLLRGRVVKNDIDAFPGLVAWYERNGFVAQPAVERRDHALFSKAVFVIHKQP